MYIPRQEKVRLIKAQMMKRAIDMSKDHFKGKGGLVPRTEIEQALHNLKATVSLIKTKVKAFKAKVEAVHAEDPTQYMEDILDDAREAFIMQYSDSIISYIEGMKKGLIGLLSYKELTPAQIKLYAGIKEKLDGLRLVKGQQVEMLVYDWFEEGSTLKSSDHLLTLWQKTSEKAEGSSSEEGGDIYTDVGGIRVHFVGIPQDQREPILHGIKKASSLIKQSKFPKIDKAAYGDIVIVSNSTTPSASYDATHDMIWVNLKKQTPFNEDFFVQTLIHEICHRYYEHVLDAKDKQNWENFYKHVLTKNKELTIDTIKRPMVGDSLSKDHGIYIHAKNKKGVDELVPPGLDLVISVKAGQPAPHMPSMRINVYTVSTHIHGVTEIITDLDLLRIGFFPTQYSSEDSEEFLAEAMSLSITGLINPKVKEFIEEGLNTHFVIPYTDTIKNIVTKPVQTSQFIEYSSQGLKELQPLFKQVFQNPQASKDLKDLAMELRELIIDAMAMGASKTYMLPRAKVEHFLSEVHKLSN